ncbi:MAG: CBS domain-containing protein [Betaproteobacteria bacterium]|nr:CBS domain-containing protein [Betaproteobacteria bacterium]
MTVATILNPAPYTVNADDHLLEVVRITLEKRFRSLPVVDGEGRYRGMVSLHGILGLLLPTAATVDHGLADLAFVADTLDDLKEVLQGFVEHRVSDHMDPGVKPVHPETSIVEATLLMFRTGENLPVVDRSTGRLVGLISPWEVLGKLV